MQLISTLLFILSLVILAGAILFVALWHRSRQSTSPIKLLREGIGHIGISAAVEYPDTTAPLISLLDEEYPQSEAIIITDLQRNDSTFGSLIRRFRLTKVNHTHLRGVRALYRSRHRAFRRVVVVDLPTEQRSRAANIAKRVASYDYILHLKGECRIAYNALTYCANIIALHPAAKALSLESIIGGNAKLERADHANRKEAVRLLTNRALAWSSSMPLFLIVAISLPSIIVFFAHISGDKLLALTAIVFVLAFCSLLYLSCRAVSEKGLSATTNAIVKNFCRFLVEHIKNFHYLYKERSDQSAPTAERAELLNKVQKTENSYD